MVYKTDKRRVYSGNTLRASNSRYNRQYRRQSCLVRQSENVTKVTGIFEELGLDQDNVVYSFNKKGRWLIPQILKQEILTDSKDLGDIKVDLVESHKMKKQGKCTGFLSNKGFVKRVVPKKTYFNVASLQSPKKVDITPSTAPHMTMNVLYPCPATSSIAHNPKYIRYEDLATDQLEQDDIDRPQQSSPIKSKSRKQRRKIGTRQLVDNYLDEVEHQEDEDYEIDTTENVRNASKSVSVEDILVHSRRMQDILSGGAKIPKYPATRRETKDRVVYINRQEEEEVKEKNEETKQTEEKEATCQMEHVRVNIPTNEVAIETLKQTFGENYSECRCSPRKFVIDITKQVQNTLLKSKAFRDTDVLNTDLSTALIFVYDIFGSLDNTDADMFKIFLNMKTKKRFTRINTFPEDGVYGVEDIVNKAVSYIETIPCDEFIHRDSFLPYTRQASTEFEMLAESRGTNVMSIDSIHHRVTVKDILQRREEEIDETESLITLGFESLPPDTCSICCEAIQDSSATALQTCGHWFCDRCWGDHLFSVANSGSGRITCPEYKCQSIVDYDILLTTSNIQIVQKVFRRRLTMDVDIEPDSKWCPNKHCGRAIKCARNTMGKRANITCSCGTHICFDCLKPAHWPLSCDHAASYSRTLQKHGDEVADDENYIRYAQGKECPKCKQFLEKNGGCFYMTCICGCSFCWGCGKAFENHQDNKQCRPRLLHANGDLFNTKKRQLNVVQITPDSTKGYKKAVQYRCLRHSGNVRIMSSVLHKMSTSLKMHNRRYGDRVGGELVDFTPSRLADEMTVADKIRPFLDSMVGVYMEISHICELTTVFLDKSDNLVSMSRSSRQAVIVTRDRLELIGGEIFSVFQFSSKHNMKDTISHLWTLRFQCKKAMDSLVKLLKC